MLTSSIRYNDMISIVVTISGIDKGQLKRDCQQVYQVIFFRKIYPKPKLRERFS